MKSKATMPIIVIAVIGLIAFLVFLGKKTMSGPEAIKTAPPPWIDPATGKPKAGVSGSSGANTPAPGMSGAPGAPKSGGQ